MTISPWWSSDTGNPQNPEPTDLFHGMHTGAPAFLTANLVLDLDLVVDLVLAYPAFMCRPIFPENPCVGWSTCRSRSTSRSKSKSRSRLGLVVHIRQCRGLIGQMPRETKKCRISNNKCRYSLFGIPFGAGKIGAPQTWSCSWTCSWTWSWYCNAHCVLASSQ